MYIFDTREQKNDHIKRYFDRHKIPYRVEKLDTGDYQIEGKPQITVDRKRNINELAHNLTNREDRARFLREVRRAYRGGIKMVILCEHSAEYRCLDDVAKWKSKYVHLTGARVVKLANDLRAYYGVEFVFCSKQQTPQKIIEILESY